MIFVKRPIKWPTLKEPMRLYLAQLESRLDPRTHRLLDGESKRKKIDALIKLITKQGRPHNIVVLPEISIPLDQIYQLTKRFAAEMPDYTICILGIELISVRQGRQLAKDLEIEDSDLQRVLDSALEDQPINLCLIAFKNAGGRTRLFLQPKVTHSKFQGDIELDNSLAQSDFLYHFHGPQLSFVVVICSDLFNRQAGELPRIIDAIDYRLLKQELAVDFIFNIQYNRRPEDGLFLHSLQRLFDDGYGVHGKLCVVFLNSLLDGPERGGLSKVLFHERTNLQARQAIRQLDAPVVGYELPADETLLCCTFNRLPRFWDRQRDPHPMQLNTRSWSEDAWVDQHPSQVGYVVPIEKGPIPEIEDLEEVAAEFSRLGKFDQAISWARKAEEHWASQRNSFRQARTLKTIAKQYRNQGRFLDALQAYAEAESLARKQRDPDSLFLTLRIRAGRVMVERYLLKGECLEADREYDSIVNELKEYIRERGEAAVGIAFLDSFHQYELNALRQQAEMRRVMGRYEESLRAFQKAYDSYEYCFHEEKANAALGLGEAYRMLGRREAEEKFQEVIRYAKTHKNTRLWARALRSYIELERMAGRDIDGHLDDLKKLSERAAYLYGMIWWNLLSGAVQLSRDPEKSLYYFAQALALTKTDGQCLLIEHAHCTLGCAEAQRIGEFAGKGQALFTKALAIYEPRSITWGILRSRLGLILCGTPLQEIDRTHVEGADVHLLGRVQSGLFGAHETLFGNLP